MDLEWLGYLLIVGAPILLAALLFIAVAAFGDLD